MKLTVLIICNDDDNKILPELNENYMWKRLNIEHIEEELINIILENKPLCYVTINNNGSQYINGLSYEFKKRWINFENIKAITNNKIINHTIKGIMSPLWTENEPLFSIITTAYCSGKKIERPWNSLLNQTYNNFEWIIWDDSGDKDNRETWKRATEYRKKDPRVHCFTADTNNKYIGEVKRYACGLARGNW